MVFGGYSGQNGKMAINILMATASSKISKKKFITKRRSYEKVHYSVGLLSCCSVGRGGY
jgi:hypothetical protein